MSTSCALGGWEQVGEENDIVFRVAGVGSVAVDRGRECAMAMSAEISPDNFVFLGRQDIIEGLTDQLEGKEVIGPAVRED